MPGYVLAAVLFSALLHASWNALAKGRGNGDPLIRAALISAGGAAVSLPLLAVTGLPHPASCAYLVASILIHVVYFLLVGLTLRAADLSVVYPLTRGSAPLGTALLSLLLMGEALTTASMAGVALLSAGVVLIGARALRARGLDGRSALLVAANAAVIIAYTLIDGAGVRLSQNPPAYIAALMIGTGLAMLPVIRVLEPGKFMLHAVAGWPFALMGGALLTASYGIALWAMTKAPIAVVSAARETSVLFAALIGALFLAEPVGPARIAGAALVLAGLLLLRLG